MPRETSLVRRAAEALRKVASKPDGLVQRVSDKWALPQLWHYLKINALTHPRGMEQFLKGDEEVPLFAPGVWHAPLKWRPIPGPDTPSLSRVTLSTTDAGTALLRGHYGGTRGELGLLSGKVSPKASPVGAGACGIASRDHWSIDLAQHLWLELKLRTDQRPYELILQCDGEWEGSEKIWRADIPVGPPPAAPVRAAGEGGGGRGAYGVLGVEEDASADEIRDAFRSLAKESHPDLGGDSEAFKRVSKAYAILGDAERRAEYDENGPADEEEAALSDLGEWRSVKVPFTAFKDRSFYSRFDRTAAVYILLRGEEPGPFAFELGEMKAGRCEKAQSDGAGNWGHISCEQGHCECGYYNGLRCEAFDGPIVKGADGRLPKGALEWGHAEHHLKEGEWSG